LCSFLFGSDSLRLFHSRLLLGCYLCYSLEPSFLLSGNLFSLCLLGRLFLSFGLCFSLSLSFLESGNLIGLCLLYLFSFCSLLLSDPLSLSFFSCPYCFGLLSSHNFKISLCLIDDVLAGLVLASSPLCLFFLSLQLSYSV
jgi:hypothetical protein